MLSRLSLIYSDLTKINNPENTHAKIIHNQRIRRSSVGCTLLEFFSLNTFSPFLRFFGRVFSVHYGYVLACVFRHFFVAYLIRVRNLHELFPTIILINIIYPKKRKTQKHIVEEAHMKQYTFAYRREYSSLIGLN